MWLCIRRCVSYDLNTYIYEAILSVCVNVHAKCDEEIYYYCVLSAFVCEKYQHNDFLYNLIIRVSKPECFCWNTIGPKSQGPSGPSLYLVGSQNVNHMMNDIFLKKNPF